MSCLIEYFGKKTSRGSCNAFDRIHSYIRVKYQIDIFQSRIFVQTIISNGIIFFYHTKLQYIKLKTLNQLKATLEGVVLDVSNVKSISLDLVVVLTAPPNTMRNYRLNKRYVKNS